MAQITILEMVNEIFSQIGQAPLKQLCHQEGALSRQILALAHSLGAMLSRCHRWECLTKTHQFKTVRGRIQPSGVPEDFLDLKEDDRFPKLYRIQYRTFRSSQDLIEDETLCYDYISSHWVVSQDGKVEKSRITEDTDLVKFDSHLFTLGLKSHFLEEKGLDFMSSKMDFSKLLDHLVIRNQVRKYGQMKLSYS